MKRLMFVLVMTACTSDPDPTVDFDEAVECDACHGVYVDHGYRGVDAVFFEAECMPKCHRAPNTPVCDPGTVFYTVPVQITDSFPSGNACFCMAEVAP